MMNFETLVQMQEIVPEEFVEIERIVQRPYIEDAEYHGGSKLFKYLLVMRKEEYDFHESLQKLIQWVNTIRDSIAELRKKGKLHSWYVGRLSDGLMVICTQNPQLTQDEMEACQNANICFGYQTGKYSYYDWLDGNEYCYVASKTWAGSADDAADYYDVYRHVHKSGDEALASVKEAIEKKIGVEHKDPRMPISEMKEKLLPKEIIAVRYDKSDESHIRKSRDGKIYLSKKFIHRMAIEELLGAGILEVSEEMELTQAGDPIDEEELNEHIDHLAIRCLGNFFSPRFSSKFYTKIYKDTVYYLEPKKWEGLFCVIDQAIRLKTTQIYLTDKLCDCYDWSQFKYDPELRLTIASRIRDREQLQKIVRPLRVAIDDKDEVISAHYDLIEGKYKVIFAQFDHSEYDWNDGGSMYEVQVYRTIILPVNQTH